MTKEFGELPEPDEVAAVTLSLARKHLTLALKFLFGHKLRTKQFLQKVSN